MSFTKTLSLASTTLRMATVVTLRTLVIQRPNTREGVRMIMKAGHSAVDAAKAISRTQPCTHISNRSMEVMPLRELRTIKTLLEEVGEGLGSRDRRSTPKSS